MMLGVAEAKVLVTADELSRMPDDGREYELVEGEVIAMPPAGVEHDQLAGEIYSLVRAFVRANRLGRVFSGSGGFRLFDHPDTVRAPDVAFVSRDRAFDAHERGYFRGAPDLAVEIVSPSESAQEIRLKVDQYLRAGARLVWVVYPRTRSVTVFRADGTVSELRDDDTHAGEDVLPGFSCPVAALFEIE
jgi:Uma2 family endonuclease